MMDTISRPSRPALSRLARSTWAGSPLPCSTAVTWHCIYRACAQSTPPARPRGQGLLQLSPGALCVELNMMKIAPPEQ